MSNIPIYKVNDFVKYNGQKGIIKNIMENDLETGQQMLVQFYFPPGSVGPPTYDVLLTAEDVTEWVNT